MGGLDVAVQLDEIERHVVVELDAQERPERLGGRQSQDLRQKSRGGLLVPRRYDGVIQMNAHLRAFPFAWPVRREGGDCAARIQACNA